jgi:putative membrane protein
MLATILTGLVAAIHLYIVVLEMVLWEKPAGRRAFGTTAEFAAATKVLAANQGLYNGFLAAGLIWGLWLGAEGLGVKTFFLACVARRRPVRRGHGEPQDPLHPDGAGRTRARRALARLVAAHRAKAAQRSVSFSSMRRFFERASSVSPGSSGWNSPKPAATRRLAGTPFSMRYFTTEVERADDSSQLSR